VIAVDLNKVMNRVRHDFLDELPEFHEMWLWNSELFAKEATIIVRHTFNNVV